jgi:hypothetical protein
MTIIIDSHSIIDSNKSHEKKPLLQLDGANALSKLVKSLASCQNPPPLLKNPPNTIPQKIHPLQPPTDTTHQKKNPPPSQNPNRNRKTIKAV